MQLTKPRNHYKHPKPQGVTTTQGTQGIEGLMGSHYMQAVMSTDIAKDNVSKQVTNTVLVAIMLAELNRGTKWVRQQPNQKQLVSQKHKCK